MAAVALIDLEAIPAWPALSLSPLHILVQKYRNI
jgi:hypothetical protein